MTRSLLNRNRNSNKEFHEETLHPRSNQAPALQFGAGCCEESARNLSTTPRRCRAEPNFTGKCFGHTHERTHAHECKRRGTRSVNVERAARSPSTCTPLWYTTLPFRTRLWLRILPIIMLKSTRPSGHDNDWQEVANGRNCADEIVLSVLAINSWLDISSLRKISGGSAGSKNFILHFFNFRHIIIDSNLIQFWQIVQSLHEHIVHEDIIHEFLGSSLKKNYSYLWEVDPLIVRDHLHLCVLLCVDSLPFKEHYAIQILFKG